MDFFEAVKRRKSIRRFTSEPIDPQVVQKALEAAVWAPNSSNVQTWDFYWVQSPEKKAGIVKACLNQSAARTASELVVITANPAQWRRSHPYLLEWVKGANAPKMVVEYYGKLIPTLYRWGYFGIFGLVKWCFLNVIGLFRPITRKPCFRSEIYEVAIKSAALACENLVLAVAAQDHDSCMMEGFDEVRVKRALGLSRKERVVMVIGIGKAKGVGTWAAQSRIPNQLVIHRV